MMTPQQFAEGLGWLSEMAFGPDKNPATETGRAWLSRLTNALAEIRATGAEWVQVCRDANARGGNHPTSGELARLIGEARIERAREERETEYRDRKLIDPSRPNESAGWSNGRSLTADYRAVQDLVRRGHPGQSSGESYQSAVMREERERAEAEERGREYRPRVYGPSLEAPTNPMRRMAQSEA